ncbi:MAG: hypothetical protein L0H73_11005 [Nitrococcus sp.]|nr:hypothetical protein [Nitrococcus sp.]
MTIVTEKVSSLTTSLLSRFALLVTISILAVAGQARSADPRAWEGQYKSTARHETVFVTLMLDASPPELLFKTMECRVGLKPVSKDAISVYSIVPYPHEASGPYCGSWVGGLLRIQRIDDDPSALKLQMELSKRGSYAKATLTPVTNK